MEIRPIKQSDNKNEISRIYENSWRVAYRGIIPKEYLDSIPKGHWVKHLNNKNMYHLIAIQDGKFIGTSSYCSSRSDEFKDFGEIVSIYLLPEYMGKGYGKKLFEATVKELILLGHKNIFLWVLEENTRARSFYEKQGFKLSNNFINLNMGGKNLKELAYTKSYNYNLKALY